MKYIYNFNEGTKDLKNLLGGKGANLAEMTTLGLPIPFGFTITTKACENYYNNNKTISEDIHNELERYLTQLENNTGKKLGCEENPLLVSVRSGAKISMPGMMDTVLNLGLNDKTVIALSKITNNERFAFDSYRRFIQMFSDVVLEINKNLFEDVLKKIKSDKNYDSDLELTVEDLKEIVKQFKEIVKKEYKKDFPMDTKEQLIMAIEAVFKSWDNDRANIYRNLNNIPYDIFTAVNIQSMVFGNTGNKSGTGVLFTRNPSNGEKEIYGEYLMNAQGEDVVAGIRTPKKLQSLKDDMPHVHKELLDIVVKLETHYKDMQDIEFTIENEKLYLLQTRNGKRSGAAMVKIAVDLYKEGIINKRNALLRIDPSNIDQLLFPTFSQEALKTKEIAKGLGASPGAVSGKIYFDSEKVKEVNENGEKAILVREETSPEDIEGMHNSIGIITLTGGATSHAAVVARGMGKPCIVGCSELTLRDKKLIINNEEYKEGDLLSFDGTTGKIYLGELETEKASINEEFQTILDWSNEIKRMDVKANADNAYDAQVAINFGAKGIGLCRTEHMFFQEERILIVREMIIAKTKEERVKALDKLFEFQKKDFKELYRVTQERSVTIRLLDPPLHEFLPKTDEELLPLVKSTNKPLPELKKIITNLAESNPMLGHRGCRLAITYPEIYNMQAKAIITAAIEINKELNINLIPEIKIPLVAGIKEYISVKEEIEKEIQKVFKELNTSIEYLMGIMVEVPRAAIISDKLAKFSDFLSYGTNDLTQMTLGFSRDDSTKFLDDYIAKNLFKVSPFKSIDQRGVGKLVEISANFGRMGNPNIRTGVCGEHGGDPESIYFFDKINLDYVSCSPYRVPIAIVASAIATLKNNN